MKKTKRIMVVIGTRPEAVKMLPLVRELRQRPAFEVRVVVTGQHRQMLDQVFDAFAETSDIDLALMSQGQSLSKITSAILEAMTDVIQNEEPDLVLVHGDTTTAMASALAASYCRKKIGHVEAGLRSYDLTKPWPEEMNRVYIDAIADFRFAPTSVSAENLSREYNNRAAVIVTGNTGIDAVLYISRKIDTEAATRAELDHRFGYLDRTKKLLLVTAHRRESFGTGLQEICQGIAKLSERDDIELIYPVHLNPNVYEVVRKLLRDRPNVHLVDPVGYVEMIYLMKRAHLVLTDSGGIQEEAPALGKPVLVMRDVTERPEALATGVVQLVGTDSNLMVAKVNQLLDDQPYFQSVARQVFPFGDGTASRRICDSLESW